MSASPWKRRIFSLALSGGLALAVALCITSASPASYPAPAQRLIVQTERDFAPALVLLDERGKTRASLGADPGQNGSVAVSRQGTAFAYVASTDAFQLPEGVDVPERIRRQFERRPQAALAFGSFLYDVVFSASNSYTIGFITLSNEVVPAVPSRPAWSRTGRRIVVAQAHRGRVHLFSYDLPGLQARRQVTQSPGRDLNPRFSPDGRTIVFERHLAGAASLYSIRPDGTGLRQLTFWSGDELSADFSPDGRSLVFTSSASGRFQLYVLSLADGAVRRLTSNFGNDRRPVWSPDGRWIAFSSDRDGDSDVFLIDPAGTHERKLTRNATEDLVQDWQLLRETRPPVIRALPGSGPRGNPLRLRYSLREESGVARVVGAIELPYGGADVRVGRSPGGVVRTKPGRIHVAHMPYAELTPEFPDLPEREVPGRIRFCVAAVDPLGNTSRVSCAMYRFH